MIRGVPATVPVPTDDRGVTQFRCVVRPLEPDPFVRGPGRACAVGSRPTRLRVRLPVVVSPRRPEPGVPNDWPGVGSAFVPVSFGIRLPVVPVSVASGLGRLNDCPGVGAGVGPVPLGIRSSVVPVPGVPTFEGNVKDWPGVGAGVGPVPLGIELPVEPVDPPVVDPGVDPPGVDPELPEEELPPELAPPLLEPPDPLLWPNAENVFQAKMAAASKQIDFDIVFSFTRQRAIVGLVPTFCRVARGKAAAQEQCALSASKLAESSLCEEASAKAHVGASDPIVAGATGRFRLPSSMLSVALTVGRTRRGGELGRSPVPAR